MNHIIRIQLSMLYMVSQIIKLFVSCWSFHLGILQRSPSSCSVPRCEDLLLDSHQHAIINQPYVEY